MDLFTILDTIDTKLLIFEEKNILYRAYLKFLFVGFDIVVKYQKNHWIPVIICLIKTG